MLYKLKPHFRDILVEGRNDAAWINWYIGQIGAPHARAFAIDDRAFVPSEIVAEIQHEVNPRGRVLAAGLQFSSWPDVGKFSLTCIVDADYDLYQRREVADCVLKTDYASMDVYSLLAAPLNKFLTVFAKTNIAVDSLVSHLKPAWAALYALRYVLHTHSGGSRLVKKFADKVVDDSGNIIFDCRELLQTATPSLARPLIEELQRLYDSCVVQIPDSTLDGIRGHDIAPIIVRFLNLKNDMANIAVVEMIMRSAIELRDIEDQGLFTQLRARISETCE